MDKDIIWITQYVNSLHENGNHLEQNNDVEKLVKKEINNEKVPLDMKILQQRMDSVSTMKYYKDLKNDRLKYDQNISYVKNEEDLFKEINNFYDNKPWSKSDTYTKKKKIMKFVDTFILQNQDVNKEQITKELLELLEQKKINKKNIEFDDANDIIRLDKYNITC
jgi:hypothetical protein